MRLSLFPLLPALGLVAALYADVDPAYRTRVGEFLPPARATSTQGETVDFQDPAPLTLLMLVDSDSTASRQLAMSAEEYLHPWFRSQKGRMIAIARGKSEEAARAMARDWKLGYPVLPDPDRKLFSLFASEGVPRVVLADKEGKIRYQHAGYRKGREAEVLLAAQSLMKDGAVPAFIAAEPGVEAAAMEPLGARDLRGRKAPALLVEKWVNPAPPTEGKFVMYEFWATWCGPCRQAMPGLDRLARQYSDKLVILSISDEETATVERFVKKQGISHPVAVDTQGRMMNALAIQGIPHAYIADPDGTVVWQGHPGTLESDTKALEALLAVPRPGAAGAGSVTPGS